MSDEQLNNNNTQKDGARYVQKPMLGECRLGELCASETPSNKKM